MAVAWQSIQATVDWIENHLAEEISINTLAKIANLSPYYFQRLFRQLVGKSVMEYVKYRRLARVSNRLIFNHDTILYSCCHYGFENHETFCRAFKEAYGITPTEFRKYIKPICHFQKPILTEKGLYVMEHEAIIEDLQEINYLAIPNFVSMDDGSNAYAQGEKQLDQCLKDGSIDRLKKTCNTDMVYTLFCNTYDAAAKMCSNDFACITQEKITSPEFRSITIRPSKYAVFSSTCRAPMTITQANIRLDDIFWKEWLPHTNYKSVIDFDWNEGSAVIGLCIPLDVNANEFSIKIWYPITEK